MMEKGCGPEKPFLGDFTLIGAFRHIGMGLA
jgi:hypothetical protein